MSEDGRNPSGWAEVYNHAMDVRLADLHTGLPAKILAYSGTKNAATVQPLIMWRTVDEAGRQVVRKQPAIGNVPCFMLRGGQARVTMPIAAGDYCYLLFAEQSMDRWKGRGGEVDPVDFRRFNMSDAFALVGIQPLTQVGEVIPTDRMTIGYRQGPKVHIHDDEIRLGSNAATRGVARVNDTISVDLGDLENAILTVINGFPLVFGVGGVITSGMGDVLG